jgi:acetyl-CoA carboxylase biotin carboxyl carrier protein
MDFKNIQELIKTVNESELTSFEIESDGITIKMQKGVMNVNTNVESTIVNTEKAKDIKKQINEKAFENSKALKQDIEVNENIEIVCSPIVGTFYSSPSPKDDDFVKVGSQVKKGQTLCIIEAMKLMNEIEAECDGTVIEILAKKEQMVEYGQHLFKINKNY